MRKETLIQFLGFRVGPKVREYTFSVRGNGENPLEFLLTISNEAFLAHRVRYQDGPDVCSRWIHHQLEANSAPPPRTRHTVSDAELEDYRAAHMPKARRGMMYKPSREAF